MNPMTNVNQGQPYYGQQSTTPAPAAFYAVPVYYPVNAMSRAMPRDPQIAPGWPDLRRPAGPVPQPVSQPVVYVDIPNAGANDSTLKIPGNLINFEPDSNPVVYIDLPEQSGSITVKNGEREARERISNDVDGSRVTSPGIHQMYLDRPYPNPAAESHTNIHRGASSDRKPSIPDTVYIDIPNSGTAGVIDESGSESRGTSTTSSRQGTLNLRRAPLPPKTTINNNKDEPDTPVVYIDLPEQQGSSTTVQRGADRSGEATNSRSSSGYATNSSNGSDFVQQTIFFDQFKNRRIEVGQSNEAPQPEPNAQTELTLDPTQFPYATHLGSVYPSPTSENTQPVVPITEFTNPPPAYSEIDTTSPPSYPRTEVIVPNNQNPIGIASSGRKLVSCPHCSRSVHTLSVRENACITHVIAIILLLVFLPLGLLVYCTDYFKYRNHYCPNCNKLIGYEIPMFCQGMTYTKPPQI